MANELETAPSWECIYRQQLKRDGDNEASRGNYTGLVLHMMRDWAAALNMAVIDDGVEFQNKFAKLAAEMGEAATAFVLSAPDEDGLLERILKGGEDDIHQSRQSLNFWGAAKKVMYAAYGKPLSVEARAQAKKKATLPTPAAVSLTEREAGEGLNANKVADWLLDHGRILFDDMHDGEDAKKVAAFAFAESLIESCTTPACSVWQDSPSDEPYCITCLKSVASAASPTRKGSSELDGVELIAVERQEQIHKHGWDVKHDQDYGRGELVQAAATCLSLYVTGDMASINVAGQYNQRKMWPWQSEFGMTYYAKIWAKSDVDKLKVAGALIAAEIDRLQAPPQP